MKHTYTTKMDLAQAYFPYIDVRSARHKLMQIIKDDGELTASLREAGYKPLSHAFSPAQLELIFLRLGNPFK